MSADGVVYSQSTGRFEYYEDGGVLGVRPTVGPEAGGIQVTVVGERFESWREMRCKFGRVERVGEVMSSSLMRCLLPEQSSGLVIVHVSKNGGERSDNGKVAKKKKPRGKKNGKNRC